MSESEKAVPVLRILGGATGSLTCSLCKKTIHCGFQGVAERFAVVSNDVCVCDITIAELAVQYLQFVEEQMLQGKAPAVAEEFLKRLFHETFLAKYFAAVGNCPEGFYSFALLVKEIEGPSQKAVREAVDRTFCQENQIFPAQMSGGICIWAFRGLGEDDLPSLAMWQAALRPAPLVGMPTFLRVNHPDFQALLDKYYPVPVAQTTFDKTKSASYSQEEIISAVEGDSFFNSGANERRANIISRDGLIFNWEDLQGAVDVAQDVFQPLPRLFCAENKVFPVHITVCQGKGSLFVATPTPFTPALRKALEAETGLETIQILVDSEETIHKALERWGWLLGRKRFLSDEVDEHVDPEVAGKFLLANCRDWGFFPFRMEGKRLIVATQSGTVDGTLGGVIKQQLLQKGFKETWGLPMSHGDLHDCIRLFGKKPVKAVSAESVVVPPALESAEQSEDMSPRGIVLPAGRVENDGEGHVRTISLIRERDVEIVAPTEAQLETLRSYIGKDVNVIRDYNFSFVDDDGDTLNGTQTEKETVSLEEVTALAIKGKLQGKEIAMHFLEAHGGLISTNYVGLNHPTGCRSTAGTRYIDKITFGDQVLYSAILK